MTTLLSTKSSIKLSTKSRKLMLKHTFEYNEYINKYIGNNIRQGLFKILKKYYIECYYSDILIYLMNGDNRTFETLIINIIKDLYEFRTKIFSINIPCNILRKNVYVRYRINLTLINIIDIIYKYKIKNILENEYQLLKFISNPSVKILCKNSFYIEYKKY